MRSIYDKVSDFLADVSRVGGDGPDAGFW